MTKKDQMRIGAEVEPGARLVERRTGTHVSIGMLAPVKNGQALQAGTELVRLSPSADDEWHDVETVYRHEPVATSSGPPQVATPAYSDGWGRVFGKKQTVGVA